MDEELQNRIYDLVYEMKGLSATLLSAGHGSLEDPEKIIEYVSCQVSRLASELSETIS